MAGSGFIGYKARCADRTACSVSLQQGPIKHYIGSDAEAPGGKPSTRLAIKGPPGVGKTTLVQYLKSEVLRDAILSRPEPVAVSHTDTTDTFLLRLLSYVYETIVSHPLHASVRDVEPVQSARQLIRAFRLRSGGLSLTGPGGIGVGVSRETDVVTPEGVTAVEAPRLLRELARVIVDRLEAKGILVHVNNLENLSEPDQTRSAGIMRDLRDQVLMNEHYHFVIVGTADAIQTVVTSHKQVRDVFGLPVPSGHWRMSSCACCWLAATSIWSWILTRGRVTQWTARRWLAFMGSSPAT